MINFQEDQSIYCIEYQPSGHWLIQVRLAYFQRFFLIFFIRSEIKLESCNLWLIAKKFTILHLKFFSVLKEDHMMTKEIHYPLPYLFWFQKIIYLTVRP